MKTRVHKKTDGYLAIQADGSTRFLGFWETAFYLLFRRLPGEKPEASRS